MDIDDICITLKKSNNKFNYIYINTMYVNYDYLLSSINLLVKLPYFMYIVLNSLKVLKNNGNLDVIFYYCNLEIPSIKKLFSLLITSIIEIIYTYRNKCNNSLRKR